MAQNNKQFTTEQLRLALGVALMDLNKNILGEVNRQQKTAINKICLRLIATTLANLGIDKEVSDG